MSLFEGFMLAMFLFSIMAAGLYYLHPKCKSCGHRGRTMESRELWQDPVCSKCGSVQYGQ